MLEEGSKDAGGHGERKAGGEVGGKTGIPEPVRSRGSQVQGRWSEGWTSTVGLWHVCRSPGERISPGGEAGKTSTAGGGRARL